MANRGAAALAWIPLPGLSVLLARRNPGDRLVRFHARQATWVILPFYVLLIVLGSILRAAPATSPVLTPVSALLLAALLVGCLVGGTSALGGRFVRIRPVWDVLTTTGSARQRSS